MIKIQHISKLKFKKRFSSRFKLSFGSEYFSTKFDERFEDLQNDFKYGYTNNNFAGFVESDLIFSKSFAMKLGLRADRYSLSDEFKISPRLSLAYKTSENGQLSLAYGRFYQSANSDLLKFNQDLNTQSTDHYILNYQFVNDGRIFRAELYRKNYDDLVKFDTDENGFQTDYSNLGDGFSQGLDLFWRDNKSFDNVDYWLSYSYLDTKREYQDYPTSVQPNFANNHNFSVVAKYWIEDWKSQVGFSYTFGSGRPYNNPNRSEFMSEKTQSYNNISLNWAYLLDPQKILYFSVNNAFGFNNVNGYQFANTPNVNGNFDSRALRPAADQFFFIGFFWTISEDGKDNQLDNL